MANELDNARFMQRRVKATGKIDLDEDERALIVHYEIEASVLDDAQESMRTERRLRTKRIVIKTLTEHTDINTLAWEIIDRQKLIPEAKHPRVCELLGRLQESVLRVKRGSRGQLEREHRRRKRREKEAERERRQKEAEEQRRREDTVSMDQLSAYMETLYDEDLNEKVKGTANVYALAQKVGNLEPLLLNDALINGLTRTLKEDFKKKLDLCFNIVGTFLSFSHFSQMHDVLLRHGVPDMALRVIELELRRAEARESELRDLAQALRAKQGGEEDMADGFLSAAEEDTVEVDGKRHEKADRRKRDKKDKKEKSARDSKHAANLANVTEEMVEKEKKRVRSLMKKQNRVLHVCLRLLLNMAEDSLVERRLVERKLVSACIRLLDRNSTELLALTLTVMRKLSIFQENVEAMVKRKAIDALARLVPCPKPAITVLAMRVLFNMSFHTAASRQMVASGLLIKISNQLKEPQFRGVAIRLLYHLSADDKCKSTFAYTETVPMLLQLVLNFPQPHVAPELGALAINLTLSPKNCINFCKGDGLRVLVGRAIKTGDPLLLRVLHNLARWSFNEQEGLDDAGDYQLAGMWAPYVPHLYRMLCSHDDGDAVVELLGLLASVTPLDLDEDVPLRRILAQLGAVEVLKSFLVPNFSQEDLMFRSIMLTGAIALDPDCCEMLASARVPFLVLEVLERRRDDPDMAAQAAFALVRMLRHADSCADLLADTRAVDVLCSMLGTRASPAAALANAALDLLVDYDRARGDGRMWELVREQRFELHNQEWLELVQDAGDDAAEGKFADHDVDAGTPRGMEDSMEGGDWHVRAGHETLAMDVSAVMDGPHDMADGDATAWAHDSMPDRWGSDGPDSPIGIAGEHGYAGEQGYAGEAGYAGASGYGEDVHFTAGDA